jgi:8-oxo-dGTP pyrophosphatase MutT (NUDIX family)
VSRLTLEHIAAALAAHRPRAISRLAAPRRAAVAALLREGERGPEVLLMLRAIHSGDRWSGQVSFPGGREEEHDPDLRATAIRETAEEVGVDLARTAEVIGRLDAVRARNRAGITRLSVWPFVFAASEPVEPSTSDEAASVFWLPLQLAASGELDAVYDYKAGPLSLSLPCWRYQGHVVWGMTFGMLQGFLEML